MCYLEVLMKDSVLKKGEIQHIKKKSIFRGHNIQNYKHKI